MIIDMQDGPPAVKVESIPWARLVDLLRLGGELDRKHDVLKFAVYEEGVSFSVAERVAEKAERTVQ
jgi:hypothetical protein